MSRPSWTVRKSGKKVLFQQGKRVIKIERDTLPALVYMLTRMALDLNWPEKP